MKTVNSAGGIKEMGWDEVELCPLALPQGNEHSLAHAVIGTTRARKACAQIQESPSWKEEKGFPRPPYVFGF